MYKCTECGTEFDIKPDFCDCGNDEFVITVEQEKTASEQQSAKFEEKVKTQKIPTIGEDNINYSQNEIKGIYSKNRKLTPLNLMSICIFVICIILSVVIICIKPKETQNAKNINNKQQEVVLKDVPNIDKIWNNKVKEVKIVPLENTSKQESKIVIKPQMQQKTQKVVTPIKKVTSAAPKVTSGSAPKTVKTSQKSTQNKTQTQQAAQPQSAKQTQTVKQPVIQQNTKNQTIQDKTQTTQQQSIQSRQSVPTVTKSTVVSEASKRELAEYKARLRNTIGQKIDFTKVIGDGTCIVSFKINQTGKLVNRAFLKQSNNITLNDAVYKAVMSTPTYKTPPEAYNNETLNLNIKFYNGNFEISLY